MAPTTHVPTSVTVIDDGGNAGRRLIRTVADRLLHDASAYRVTLPPGPWIVRHAPRSFAVHAGRE